MSKPIIVGHGPVRVIALHGWFGSADAWKPLADVLDVQRFTYVFPDHRGYGKRMAEAGQFTMEEIAADTLALADALGWELFNLIGHSMGGKAIQRVLLDAPQRVEKLVAVTPVPASGVPFDAATWALFASAAAQREARLGIVDHSTGSRLSKAWLGRLVDHSVKHSNEAAFAAYLEAWAKGDFSSAIAGNPVPIKVIVGEHDPGLNAAAMEATYLRWYPNASLQVMANAGHYPMDETPVALATSIEQFLTDKA
nr:alpha/beta hydrolase [uncultured Roseateles sp.]